VGRRQENTGFCCAVCREPVNPLTNGSYRNHCPFCLSLHVDARVPGDRESDCRGVMRAVAVIRTKKGWQVVHRCTICGIERVNRAAFDCDQPDDIDLLIDLMQVQADTT
jgi:hypothetical protein